MKESFKKANPMAGIALACTAAGGLSLCGGVLASVLYVLLTLVLLIPVRPAFAQAPRWGPECGLKPASKKKTWTAI